MHDQPIVRVLHGAAHLQDQPNARLEIERAELLAAAKAIQEYEKWRTTRLSTFETTWKVSFPTRKVGYVTIQSYNPDTTVKQQHVAKTTDGGKTWKELDLCQNAQAREFGIGFINENVGFVGTMTSGYQTTDGGKTWAKTDIGRATNKIRVYENKDTYHLHAIGVNVYQLEVKKEDLK